MNVFVKTTFLIVLLGITHSSCDKIKSLADVKFESEFATNLNINIEPGIQKASINGVFYAEATIDPNSDDEFAKYAEKIKEINIKSARIEIVSIDPSPIQLITGELRFTTESVGDAVWSYENVSLEAGASLEMDESQWSKVNAILDKKSVFTVILSGQTDVEAGSFVAKVMVKSEIVANPL